MQIYSKNNKNCLFLISWPIFILFVLSDRARVEASKLVHKILKFINYANLCKFTEPRRDPVVQSAIIFYFFVFTFLYNFLLLVFYFIFFMSLLGRQIYIFLTLIFFFMSLPGHQIFIFWPVENCTHEIWDIWCCEMPDERYVIDVLVGICSVKLIQYHNWNKKKNFSKECTKLGAGKTPVALPDPIHNTVYGVLKISPSNIH